MAGKMFEKDKIATCELLNDLGMTNAAEALRQKTRTASCPPTVEKTIPVETYENLVRLYRSAIRLCESFHDLQDRFNPFRLQQVFNEIQATEDVLTDLNHGKNPVFHLDPVANVCATAALFAKE